MLFNSLKLRLRPGVMERSYPIKVAIRSDGIPIQFRGKLHMCLESGRHSLKTKGSSRNVTVATSQSMYGVSEYAKTSFSVGIPGSHLRPLRYS